MTNRRSEESFPELRNEPNSNREAISRTGMADTAVSVILILMISLVLAVHIMRFHDLLPSQETAMTYDRQ